MIDSRAAVSRLLFLATCCCFRSRDPLCHDFPGCPSESTVSSRYVHTYAKTVQDYVSGITGYWKKCPLSAESIRVISAISFCFKSVTYMEGALAVVDQIKIYGTKKAKDVSSFSSSDSVFSVSCHKTRPTSNVSTPKEIYEAAKRREREEPGRKITVLVERWKQEGKKNSETAATLDGMGVRRRTPWVPLPCKILHKDRRPYTQ